METLRKSFAELWANIVYKKLKVWESLVAHVLDELAQNVKFIQT